MFYSGSVYLKIEDASNVELTLPLDTITFPSLVQMHNVFSNYGVVYLEKPFEDLNTPFFDRAYKIDFDPNQSALNFIVALEALFDVEMSEQIPIAYPITPTGEIASPPPPNDPLNTNQYHLNLINAFDAYDIHQGGSKIGIPDNALLSNHPDLKDVLLDKYDVGDDDTDVSPPSPISNSLWDDDIVTHGTTVAGAAAAHTDNGKGISAPGWNNEFLFAKVTEDAIGPNQYTHWTEGMIWLEQNGADVISISFAQTLPSEMEYRVLEHIRNNGVIIVAGAGNSNRTFPEYPAAYGNGLYGYSWEAIDRNFVISVAAIDLNKVKSYWPVYQTGTTFGSWIDICTYGNDILTTSFDRSTQNPLYQTADGFGTSMSAPQVAAAIGVMLSYNPSASVDDVLHCLISSANNDIYDPSVVPLNQIGTLGIGRLDIKKALECISLDCNLPPIATILPLNPIICPNGDIELEANSGTSYLWSSGETTKNILASSTGTYSVTVTFQGGCTSTASVNVEAAPTSAEMIISEYSGIYGDGILCPSQNNYVTLTPWFGSSYQWDDGSTLREKILLNPPHGSTYSVTVSDVWGCSGVSASTQTIISVSNPVNTQVNIIESSEIFNDGTICEGASALLQAVPNSTYEWSNSQNGPVISTDQTLSVSPNSTTSYFLTITDVAGCTGLAYPTINVQDCGDPYTCPCINIGDFNIDAGIANVDPDISLITPVSITSTGIWPLTASLGSTANMYTNSGKCLSIKGNLIIDNDSDFGIYGGELQMQPGARIIVENGSKLYLAGVLMDGCSEMWRSISVEPGGELETVATVIKDGEYAIDLLGGQPSPTFTAYYTFYKNNHLSIRADFPQHSPIIQNLPFIGNTFTTEGDLLPFFSNDVQFYSSIRPFGGIQLDRTTFIVGSPSISSPLEKNSFEGLRNGISGWRTNLSVYNTDIKKIYGGQNLTSAGLPSIVNPRGTGITARSCSFVDIKDVLLEDGRAKNKTRGIAAALSNVNIESSIISDFDFGVQIDRVANKDVTILDNEIYFRGRGISASQVGLSNEFTIDNNVPIEIFDKSFSPAISIYILEPTGSSVPNARISSNEINVEDNCVGIALEKTDDWTITDNIVTFENSPLNGIGFTSGFSGNDINFTYLNNNKFLGDSSSSQFSTGVSSFGSADNIFCCNEVNDLWIGFLFQGNCDDTELRHSLIGDHQRGLVCNSGTVIGSQDDLGNQWGTSYPGEGARHDGVDAEINGSLFFVELPANTQPLWPPSITTPNATLDWFQPSLGQSTDCAGDSDCSQTPMPPTAFLPLSSTIEKVINGTYVDGSPYESALQFEAERNLFQKIKADKINDDSSLEVFFEEKSEGEIGKLSVIDELLQSIHAMSTENKKAYSDANISLEFQLNALNDLNNDLVSSATAQDTAYILNEKKEVYKQISLIMTQISNLEDNLESKSEQRLAAITKEIQNFEPQTQFGEDLKLIASIVKENLEEEGEFQNEVEKSLLLSIAQKCFRSHGNAVLNARMLYHAWVDNNIIFDDDLLCDNIERSNESFKEFGSGTEFKINPNPTSDFLFISSESALDDISVQIVSPQGKTLQTIDLTSNRIRLDLPVGVYFLNIYNQGQFIETKRFVIIK